MSSNPSVDNKRITCLKSKVYSKTTYVGKQKRYFRGVYKIPDLSYHNSRKLKTSERDKEEFVLLVIRDTVFQCTKLP